MGPAPPDPRVPVQTAFQIRVGPSGSGLSCDGVPNTHVLVCTHTLTYQTHSHTYTLLTHALTHTNMCTHTHVPLTQRLTGAQAPPNTSTHVCHMHKLTYTSASSTCAHVCTLPRAWAHTGAMCPLCRQRSWPPRRLPHHTCSRGSGGACCQEEGCRPGVPRGAQHDFLLRPWSRRPHLNGGALCGLMG